MRRRASPGATDGVGSSASPRHGRHPAHRAVDRTQARREDTEAIARLVNAVTVETAFRSTVEEVRDELISPLGANEGVIVAAGPGVKPFEQPPPLMTWRRRAWPRCVPRHDGARSEMRRPRGCRAAWLLGITIREYRALGAGDVYPDFETWDRICKLNGWPQTFMGGADGNGSALRTSIRRRWPSACVARPAGRTAAREVGTADTPRDPPGEGLAPSPWPSHRPWS